jgi:hypothetical protein
MFELCSLIADPAKLTSEGQWMQALRTVMDNATCVFRRAIIILRRYSGLDSPWPGPRSGNQYRLTLYNHGTLPAGRCCLH